MTTLTYGSATAAGRSTINQDAIVAEAAEISRFIIADGFGSIPDAQQAAQLAVTTIAAHIEAQTSSQPNVILQAVTAAYQQATQKIQQEKLNAGVSATTVLVAGERAYIGHMGCTRAYAVFADSLDRLTTDHTIEERSLEVGLSFRGDEYAPVLVQAIGQSDEAPDTLIHPLTAGTGLLLLSDGVYRAGAQLIEYDGGERVILPLSEADMLDIIKTSSDAQAACAALLADAKRRSGGDSLSAIFIANQFEFQLEK